MPGLAIASSSSRQEWTVSIAFTLRPPPQHVDVDALADGVVVGLDREARAGGSQEVTAAGAARVGEQRLAARASQLRQQAKERVDRLVGVEDVGRDHQVPWRPVEE